MRMAELYPAGGKIVLGSHLFTADDIIRYARQFDPQPFHVDPEAARHSLFGGLCASGWHTCAGWMKTFIAFWTAEYVRLKKEGKVPPELGPAHGFRDLRWFRPVFAGDTITYSVTLLETREQASRPGRLIDTILCEGVNQNGEPVIRFESTVMEFA
ncbi:MaoC family dehydratase [Rhizobium sp. TRM96647]|uniref:MaoC family dehydratase n=1 Tax=unclassified Rhizobium TaxID=2613769 RepID=UPI0021E99840|nr:MULTISPECIES: MaoC family dehydratase [unclassified Rhizobium]MCV3738054.1 MaoC family dehydratase [Rhizobium sp. TRM96647]MCV3759741.1 MaoC family dehydratase [Rhizobium sp. TRM96650]